jgi:hemerythrin
MRKETKDLIYMALDLLESISKTAKDNDKFVQVNRNVLDEVRDELFILIKQSSKDKSTYVDKKTELIGILPSILIDEKKFPLNEDLVKLAEYSLNMNILRWNKKSRNEIIGIIISEIATKKEQDLETFINAWKEFIRKPEPDQVNIITNKKDFVDVWIEFFNHYRGVL